MYKITSCFLLFSVFGFGQNIQFTDPDLLFYLTTKLCVDTNGDGVFNSDADFNNDGQIQLSEAQQVTSFSFTTVAHDIQSIGGFEHFTNLQHLTVTTISVNHLDFSAWPTLQSLKLSSNIGNFVFNNPLLTHFELQNVAFSNPLFDLTNLPNLEYVRIQSSHLTDNLIFGTHNNLEELRIFAGNYSTLNLSAMPALKYLTIGNFVGESLDISNCTVLEEFAFRYTDNFTSLIGADASVFLGTIDFIQEDYDTNPSNLELSFHNQNLFDVSIRGANSVSLTDNNTDMGNLELLNITGSVTVDNCTFTYIDSNLDSRLSIAFMNPVQLSLSNIEGIRFLSLINLPLNLPLDLSTVETEQVDIFSSSITELNLKNGNALQQFYSSYDTDIQFICVDRDELPTVEAGYSNIDAPTVINPYCSFVLGGEYHEVAGNLLVDLGTGCTTNVGGPVFDLQFTVTDGTNTDVFYADNQNSYSFTLPEGDHVLQSQLSDLEYWTVSPPSIDLSFPADTAPHIQDFCITPVGAFNDAEIFIVPINAGQPGFQSDYKIVYKNPGTTALSGTIALSFNDDTANFTAANPNISGQSTGNLTWNYTNLLPFETREISFSMHLNTPTDPVFPLNGGDTFGITAVINHAATDETAFNNNFTLNQTLVNSYDPNNITCLEGNTVSPQQIGEYVHYMIRFENNGSANATNVVVKDVLNPATFDISSLAPLYSSHDFVTRIVNGNEAEFIFENIQLPFDDADNDGFAVFKIKLLPTLSLGNIFSNQAEIYFDFNAPIVTNEEDTLIAEETFSTTEFNTTSIMIFPNPTSGTLNINATTAFSSIAIYDLNGWLLSNEISGSNKLEYQLDVKTLSAGIYFLEVQSGHSKQMVKFIKR